jgi:hypothetical protein
MTCQRAARATDSLLRVAVALSRQGGGRSGHHEAIRSACADNARQPVVPQLLFHLDRILFEAAIAGFGTIKRGFTALISKAVERNRELNSLSRWIVQIRSRGNRSEHQAFDTLSR